MKVRIKKAPQKMAYGGQNKHSLDIVRTTIDDYDPDYNDVESKNTRGADPREESTVEVEGDEVIVLPNKKVQKAVGPDHHPDPNKEGGVPMNLPEGSFVFSKRKKDGMGVKGPVLKNFGKSEGDKKTYSFAELANQYNPNKFYDAIINGAGKLDQITLNTYAANIQRYEDKLADLAILQESKKGFPQGIPDIAKEKFAKMQQYMQQAQQQSQEEGEGQQEEQQMPMAMYGYNAGGFVPDYSSVGDIYRYQGGGSTGSQDEQIAQYIQAYAQLSQKDPQEIYQALQSLAPAQQQEALKTIIQTVQEAMSQQQGGGEEQQMSQDDSGYYSAPGGEPQYAMQQEEQPSEEEAEQMRNGGSYSGTYYQGNYFANGGAFLPTYGDSSYNEQFGGQLYDSDYGMLPKAQFENSQIGKSTPFRTEDYYKQGILSGNIGFEGQKGWGLDLSGNYNFRNNAFGYNIGAKIPTKKGSMYNFGIRHTNEGMRQEPTDEFSRQPMMMMQPNKSTKFTAGYETERLFGKQKGPKVKIGLSYDLNNQNNNSQEIFEHGGLVRADNGKQVGPTPKKVTKAEFDTKVDKGGYTRIPGTNLARKGNKVIEVVGTYKPGTAGSSTAGTRGSYTAGRTVGGGRATGPCANMKFTVADMKANPGCYETFLEKENWKNASAEEQQEALDRLRKGRRSTYVPPTPGTTIAATEGMCVDDQGKPLQGVKYNPQTGKCEQEKEVEDMIVYEEGDPGPTPPDNPGGGDFGGGYYGIPFESTLGLAAAAAYPPLYIRPFYAEPEAVIPRPTFYSPERELASSQETARGMEQMAGMMNPQTAGTMASFIQGNAAKTAADTIGRYQNLNVGVANQFSPLQAQIFNSLAAQKREVKDKRYAGEAVALQQYNNAMRAYATNFAKVLGEGIQAGKKQGQLYDTNPYFTADALGRLRLKPGVNAADAIMYGTTGGGKSALTPQQYIKLANELKRQNPGATDAMIRDAMRQYEGKSKKSSSDDNDDVAFGYGQSAYPFA